MSDSNCKQSGILPVESIPGNLIGTSEIDLQVRSYAGFGKADAKFGESNLFCWFFESQKCADPKDIGKFPLLIWLNGGPGASSMGGLLLENGPYSQQSDPAGTIAENPYSWNREAHVMYWDNPVGAGYSYNTEDDYVSSESELSMQFYEALQSFFHDYPAYRDCPLYVTGESYGGKYIPAITSRIAQENRHATPESYIHIRGMAIGNPWMDPVLQMKFRLEVGFELGFLDTKQHEFLMSEWERLSHLVNDKERVEEDKWQKAFELYHLITQELVDCGGNIAIYDVRIWDDGVFGSTLENYFSMKEVKEALHVPEDAKWRQHDETGPVTNHLIQDFMTNTVYRQEGEKFDFSLPYLLDDARVKVHGKEEHLRVLLYTGNLDMSCGVRGTEAILYNLKWECEPEWRELRRRVWAEPHYKIKNKESDDTKFTKYTYRGHTKGFVKQHRNLTQIVVPRSGHLVPNSRPEVSLEMINNFVFDRGYPSFDPLQSEE